MKIKGYLEGFIQNLVDEHKKIPLEELTVEPIDNQSNDGYCKPFHEAILPEGILRINRFERSFSTKLGNSFEEVSRLIALGRHAEAHRAYLVEGNISTEAIKVIESIVDSVQTHGMKQSFCDLIKQVLSTSEEGGQKRKRIADLYFKTHDGKQYYFEIKSPKPNKGQCLEALDRLLTIYAIKRLSPPEVNTFFAMAYNPYGKRSQYKHSFAKTYLDLKNQVLIAEEFWDLVGGLGTYNQVLEIYKEVGKEKVPDMIDQLALNY